MKKSIISISGIALLLASAIAFNVVKYEQNKTRYCVIASYYWGLEVKELCNGGEHNGCNVVYCCVKSNKYGATIGNTEKHFYTWNMRKALNK